MKKYSKEEKKLLRMVRLLNKHADLVSKEDFGIVGDEETLNDIYEKINDVNEITFLIRTDLEYILNNLTNKDT